MMHYFVKLCLGGFLALSLLVQSAEVSYAESDTETERITRLMHEIEELKERVKSVEARAEASEKRAIDAEALIVDLNKALSWIKSSEARVNAYAGESGRSALDRENARRLNEAHRDNILKSLRN